MCWVDTPLHDPPWHDRQYAAAFPDEEVPAMSLDTQNFLPPPYSGDDEIESW